MHAHGVVGRDRAVQEAPPLRTAVLFAESIEGAVALPQLQHLVLAANEVGVFDWLEHGLFLVEAKPQSQCFAEVVGGRFPAAEPDEPRAARCLSSARNVRPSRGADI